MKGTVIVILTLLIAALIASAQSPAPESSKKQSAGVLTQPRQLPGGLFHIRIPLPGEEIDSPPDEQEQREQQQLPHG